VEPLVSFVLSVANLFGFYALLALGLGLIFGQLGVVNVAHGDMVMVGAYLVPAMIQQYGPKVALGAATMCSRTATTR
jgi:branched-subunit amino acid ABC-type transport system permease component